MNKIKMWWAVNHGKVIIQKFLYCKKFEDDYVKVRVALALNGISFGYYTKNVCRWDKNIFRLLGQTVEELTRKEQEHER